MGLNTFLFLLLNILLDLVLGMDSVLFFAQKNYLIREGRTLWTLFTSMFMHAGPQHLLNNVIALLIFGTTMEKMFTKRQYLITYFFSGLIGSLFSFLLLPSDSIGLGASGAIYGLMGVVIVFIPKNNLFVIFYMVYFLISSFFIGPSNWAHIFGFITGLCIAFWLKKKSQKNPMEIRSRRFDTSKSQKKVGLFSRIRWNFALKFARVKDHAFIRKEKKMAKRLMKESANPISTNEIHNKIYAERFYLLKFKALFAEIKQIPLYEIAHQLHLTEDQLIQKIIIWKMRLPMQIQGNFLNITNLALFNSTLDTIISEWEEKKHLES
ncbi:rhomboid family intramembrane serine protease [Candidatus Lokiarchaeum ossiferum]|uniref:rhomboid family intramembrane serine protease n=1 Tax=Candidatus Lokiarchaeum ossiferum TaxID=2951803 RepID=UPI00352F7EBB